MPEHVGGKQFLTREETIAAGYRVPSQEEIDAANAQWDAAERTRNPNAPRIGGFGGRFSDDLVGTEYDPGADIPDHLRKDPGPGYPGTPQQDTGR